MALLVGVRYGKKLPAGALHATRIVCGVLTFFLWYVGMLSAMSILAMLTVRTFRELRTTVLGLLVLTALMWGARHLARRVLVRSAQPSKR